MDTYERFERRILTAGLRRRAQLGLLVVAAVVAGSQQAFAQALPRLDLAGGYSTLRERGEGVGLVDTYDRGWFVSGAGRLPWPRLALVGHVEHHERENFVGEPQSRTVLLGGARVSVVRWSRLTAFGQSVFGLERFTEPALREEGVAVQSGGGLDVRLWPTVALRLQGDIRYVRQSGGDYTDWRLGTGVVLMIP
jgi:hypothetical protein